jgi:hypothetical protein
MRGMKTVITAKLKLHTTAEAFAALRALQLAYRDALPLCESLCLRAWQKE